MDKTQIKEFIEKGRANNISDDEIYTYLKNKGVDFGDTQQTSSKKEPESFIKPKETEMSFTQALTSGQDKNPEITRLQASPETVKQILPLAGAVVGGIGSAALAAPTGPVGMYAAGVVGSGSGAATGELANQAIQGKGFDTNKAKEVGKEYAVSQAIAGPASAALKSVGKGVFGAVIPETRSTVNQLTNYYKNNPPMQRVFDFMSGKNINKPISVADSAIRNTVAGTESNVGIQAGRASQNIWSNTLGKEFAKSKEVVNLPAFFSNVENKINSSVADLTQRKQLLKALEVVKKDYNGKTTVSLEGLNKLKSSWASPLPEKAFGGENITGTINNLRLQLSSEARKEISDRFLKTTFKGPEIQRAFIDYSNLQSVEELGKKAMRGKVGNPDSFFSMVKNMALFPVATVAGKVIYKTGTGIEFIGGAGLKTVSDVFNEALFGN